MPGNRSAFLLSVSNRTHYGCRMSCLAGLGRLPAFAGMIALAPARPELLVAAGKPDDGQFPNLPTVRHGPLQPAA